MREPHRQWISASALVVALTLSCASCAILHLKTEVKAIAAHGVIIADVAGAPAGAKVYAVAWVVDGGTPKPIGTTINAPMTTESAELTARASGCAVEPSPDAALFKRSKCSPIKWANTSVSVSE